MSSSFNQLAHGDTYVCARGIFNSLVHEVTYIHALFTKYVQITPSSILVGTPCTTDVEQFDNHNGVPRTQSYILRIKLSIILKVEYSTRGPKLAPKIYGLW